MLRGEAIQVLHDIIRVCADNSLFVNSVMLIAPPKDNGLMGYQLKIGTVLNDACRESIMPLLTQKNLEIQENKDHIIIHKSI